MKTVRLFKQAEDGTATWSIDVTRGTSTETYTLTPEQSLDVTFNCDSLEIDKDGTPQPVTLNPNFTTLCLRDSVQVFPLDYQLDALTFGFWAFFFSWCVVRLFKA